MVDVALSDFFSRGFVPSSSIRVRSAIDFARYFIGFLTTPAPASANAVLGHRRCTRPYLSAAAARIGHFGVQYEWRGNLPPLAKQTQSAKCPLPLALRKMVSLTQCCFSTRNFNWRIRDRFVKMVQPERDLPLHPSLPLHLAFHCLNGMECHPFPSSSGRSSSGQICFHARVVAAASDDDTLHATANAFWAMGGGCHARPSVTLQRRSLKLVLGPPSLPAFTTC